MIETPYFLVGAERSGTTLLRLMLSHHPQISWCEEFEYVVDRISPAGEFPQLKDYYDWLETNRIFQDSGLVINRNLSYPELVNDFLVQKKQQNQKPIVGATVHRHFDQLLKIWSKAAFIHIIRDPRDVAQSRVKLGWAGNVWLGVESWLEAENCWEKLKENLSPQQYIEIYYEDLITSPLEILTNLCHFIGVNYDSEMMNYYQNTTYDQVDSSLIQQWKKKLSNREIQLIEARANSLLKERGYQLSGLPQLEMTNNDQKLIAISGFFKKSYRRFKENPRLFILEYLIRRFGSNSWQKWLKYQENDQVRAKLK